MNNSKNHLYRAGLLILVVANWCPARLWAVSSEIEQACEEAKFSNASQVKSSFNPSGSITISTTALQIVLEDVKRTPLSSQLYPARIFCANWLLTIALAHEDDKSKNFVPFEPMVESFDLPYLLAPWGPKFEQIALERQDSVWGRKAFTQIQRLGWKRCKEERNPYRDVIRHSESFLSHYPRSESSDEVRLQIATAYETWWNYCVAPKVKGGISCQKPNAEEIRKKAITQFKEFSWDDQLCRNNLRSTTCDRRLERIQKGEHANLEKLNYSCFGYDEENGDL